MHELEKQNQLAETVKTIRRINKKQQKLNDLI